MNTFRFRSVSFQLLSVTSLTLTLCQLPAAAQPARWELTGVAGIANERGWSDVTSAVGVSLGVRLGPAIVGEAEVLRVSNLLPNQSSGTLTAYWLGGNVVVRLRNSGWRPFAVAGIGLGHVVLTQPDALFFPVQANTDPAFNVGGGVMIPISRRMSVRTDLRWLALFDGYDDFYRITCLTAGVAVGF
jgi:Outer membrane protein beta-barrel domain